MDVRRDLQHERQLTTEAAASVSARPPARLNEFAEIRSAPYGPVVHDITGRDFSREIVEELADARNYACWWIQQLGHVQVDEHLAGELTTAIARTLASTAVAFAHATEARELAVDVRSAA